MEKMLNDQETRVLGCLMEKAMATPDYYPLSLNALTNACNQRSNRDPVVSWEEPFVEAAAETLEEKGLVHRSTVGRVPKYEETLTRRRNMVTAEAAVLCVLLLRGPQTPGAIRSRCERLQSFDTLESLQETLDRLDEWGMVRRLARLPGHKEARYAHLLAGDPDAAAAPPETDIAAPRSAEADRLTEMADAIDALRVELDALKTAFDTFRRQFE